MGIYIEKSQEGRNKLKDIVNKYHPLIPSKDLIKSINDQDGNVCALGASTVETDSNGWLITGRGHTMAELLFALDKYMDSLSLEKTITKKVENNISVEPNIFN